MERASSVIEDLLQQAASTTVVVTHGNLMALLLKHFDARVGFVEWRALTNPDVYEVEIDAEETSMSRVWGGG
jgi:2,3-bisphosphoglycerate-dependent phosphoglycerate mutase